MQEEEKIDMNDFRIINKLENKKFPFVHSTQLYPEWPVAACADTDKEIAKEQILKKCASELISYKVPQRIEFIDKVKFAATGKKVK
jgi:acyl-CoA synthetase (AMP-forming)/AMP-acid ligase II